MTRDELHPAHAVRDASHPDRTSFTWSRIRARGGFGIHSAAVVIPAPLRERGLVIGFAAHGARAGRARRHLTIVRTPEPDRDAAISTQCE